MESSKQSTAQPLNLVIQTAFLGDLLLAIPLLVWVKKVDPSRPLGLVCRQGLGNTLKKLGIVDEVFEVSKGKSTSYREAIQKIRQFQVNYLISAHTSFRTTLFCAQIKAQRKITFAQNWNFFAFHKRVAWPQGLPESLRLLSLLRSESPELEALFAKLPKEESFYQKDPSLKLQGPPDWADPHLGWPGLFQSETETLLEKLNLEEKKWVALFPGSVWATKMWTPEGYQALGRKISSEGLKVVIMGGPDEKELGQEVADLIPGAVNLCGLTSLFESLLLVRQAKLVVGNDSSSSHMAALTQTPAVAIFGPTVLRFGYRPWGQETSVVEHGTLPCRPCGPHGHRQCPLGHHKCMKEITADQVWAAVQNYL